MSLNAALSLVLEEYSEESKKEFTNNPLAEFIRHEIPQVLEEQINDERYIIKGSAGQGQWTLIPWIAILDRFVTATPQRGFYLVYLFREDFSGLYISLNQGVTTVREQYGSEAKHALLARASDFIAKLGNIMVTS